MASPGADKPGMRENRSCSETTLRTLDLAMGGQWWREYFAEGVTDEAVEDVVAEFIGRLADATGCFVASVPIRRDHHHKSLYSLVFASRNPRAEWHFGDATAKCLDDGPRDEEAVSVIGFGANRIMTP